MKLLISALLLSTTAMAQQTTTVKQSSEPMATVEIESTISGNAEQPKTIYVLPWQDSVARIKMNGDDENTATDDVQPLDREEFLRFIQATDTPTVKPQDQ